MSLLTRGQVDRIYEVTDSLLLHRGWITIPLPATEVGSVAVMPDGKILISAPSGERFSLWIEGLRARLLSMDLSRTQRADQPEPVLLRIPGRAEGAGLRGYWDWDAPLRQVQAMNSLPRGHSPWMTFTSGISISRGETYEKSKLHAGPDLARAQDLGGEA